MLMFPICIFLHDKMVVVEVAKRKIWINFDVIQVAVAKIVVVLAGLYIYINFIKRLL